MNYLWSSEHFQSLVLISAYMTLQCFWDIYILAWFFADDAQFFEPDIL